MLHAVSNFVLNIKQHVSNQEYMMMKKQQEMSGVVRRWSVLF